MNTLYIYIVLSQIRIKCDRNISVKRLTCKHIQDGCLLEYDDVYDYCSHKHCYEILRHMMCSFVDG
jgi:hypothetical protein